MENEKDNLIHLIELITKLYGELTSADKQIELVRNIMNESSEIHDQIVKEFPEVGFHLYNTLPEILCNISKTKRMIVDLEDMCMQKLQCIQKLQELEYQESL